MRELTWHALQYLPSERGPPERPACPSCYGYGLQTVDPVGVNLGDAVEGDVEVVPVGGQHLFIAGKNALAAIRAVGLDKGPVGYADPTRFGQPGANDRLSEVRPRRRLMPPAGGFEVGKASGSRLEAVLRLTIHEDVEIAVVPGLYLERPARVDLVRADRQAQRVVAVLTEADIDKPWLSEVNPKSHVIVRWPEPVATDNPGGQHRDAVTERCQQHAEPAVELVTESAPAPMHEFVQQCLWVEDDGLAQVDAQVLEGHREQVALVQLTKAACVEVRGGFRPDSVQVRLYLTGFHASTVAGQGFLRSSISHAWSRTCQAMRRVA